MVNHVIPNSLEEALIELNEKEYILFSGGTDLMIQNRSVSETDVAFQKPVLFLSKLQELNYIRKGEEHIYIGAMTPLSTILESDMIPNLLKEVITQMASPAIRNMATLAGNISNASPAGDSLPVLYVMNALVKIQSSKASKLIPITDYITGVRKTIRQQNEMITEIIVPIPSFSKEYYKKVGTRKSDAISKVSFAGAVTIINDKVLDFRLSIGSIAPTVVRRFEIESKFIGKSIEQIKSLKNSILEWYAPFIQPIDDQRSNKEYRHHVSLKLIEDFINYI